MGHPAPASYGDGLAVLVVGSADTPFRTSPPALRVTGEPVPVVLVDSGATDVPDGADVLRIGEDVGRGGGDEADLRREGGDGAVDRGTATDVLTDPQHVDAVGNVGGAAVDEDDGHRLTRDPRGRPGRSERRVGAAHDEHREPVAVARRGRVSHGRSP